MNRNSNSSGNQTTTMYTIFTHYPLYKMNKILGFHILLFNYRRIRAFNRIKKTNFL